MTWGGLGSRGGHVIGTTRSGKAVYQRGGGTKGWSYSDHHDAAGLHEAAGNRATANAHYAAARAIVQKRRHGGVLRRVRTAMQNVFDTGPLQTDFLSSRALLFSRVVLRKAGGGMPATPAAPAAPKAPTAPPAPAPAKLPQDHSRYFHTEQAHATVPMHQLRPTKTVAQEKGGASIDNASRAMHAAYHAGGGKRAPISVRKHADGTHSIVDGNATYHAAVRHGWTSLPVRFEKSRALLKGASFAAPGPARGEHVLGKTKSGKPVFASGAKAGGFSDDDHVEAATLHARAAAYHEKHAADHAKIRDSDRDWKRSEQHHGEHDRHAKLRDHHFERVQDHLVAAGKAEEAEFDGKELRNRRPVDAKRRAKTKDELRRRTNHDHPGGHDEADVAEYASYAAPAKKRMAS